jgi:Gas vesicle synthesis protein GvpL/GvpF
VIYAYGICEPAAAAPPPDRRGLGGATLRALERDGLAAVYSRHRSLRPHPDPKFVLTHERVVEAIMARGAVLPLRFGTRLEREEALSAVLAERRVEMLRRLQYVRGHLEMGLRVIPARHPDPQSVRRERSGRDYLLARVREHREAQWAARELHAPLDALAAASIVRDRAAPPAVLVAAYLVDRGAVDEFRSRARNNAAGHEDMQVHVTGPWPPYSFVGGQEQA